MRTLLTATLAVALAILVGCGEELGLGTTPTSQALNTDEHVHSDQMQHGIVYILPGIQGVDYHYYNIRKGLQGAGLGCAIKIHPWGCQIPGINLLVNETNTLADRQWGEKIAAEIAAYQKSYPSGRVYVIGQSGGGGVAVFTAEALTRISGARQIEGLVLLDASISANYDLSTALRACREGIVNFYNLGDVALLKVGTAVMGNVDGGHGDSAGRTGFSSVTGAAPKLFQVKVTKDMVDDFADPHFADCSAAFAAQYISPWIIDRTWPPGHMRHSAAK